MSLRIELFGSLRVTGNHGPIPSVNTNRLQSLLAYLVLHAGAPQSREHLAFVLWPESNESQARTNLRQLLHHLRRALPSDDSPLVADNHTVQWRRTPNCSSDIADFDAALQDAAAKRAAPADEAAALEHAASLYHDDLLNGLYDEWLTPHREHYRQLLAQALGRLAALLEERRDYPAAIRYAERLVALDPLREPHHQLLIRLHAANDDRASAMRAYHQCLRVLRRELAIEPGPATRALFEQVHQSKPQPAPRAELPPTATILQQPLVGRQDHWKRLSECWQAAAAGRTHFSLILGEPGIGKSRLAEELFDDCASRGAAVARARCYAAQGQLAYGAIAEWLRSEPLRAACANLPEPQLAELARVLPEILAHHPAIARPRPLTESWERHHFYDALNTAFGRAAKPLLLVIDDLQWCDPDSFEWLHAFFRAKPTTGILVLGTVRPEETGRDHPLTRLRTDLHRSAQLTELPLHPLSATETAELANQIFGHPLDTAEAAALYRSTRGNPLFVVESVRAGIGTSDPAAGAAPPRVHAVISARLAQLTPPAYELAGLAATAGQSFSFDLLAKATDWDEESVFRALDELWQRRIVEGQGEEHAAAYDFTHDRLREVVYAELSPVRRRFLHRRVARALEELHAGDLDAVSGQLAAHFEAAGMPDPAIRHYRAAAAVAQHRYADSEAAGLLRRALSLCRQLPETPRRHVQELDLLVALGPVLVTTAGYAIPEVGETYERALILSRQLAGNPHLASVLSGAWVFHIVRGHLEVSRDLAQQFLEWSSAPDRASLSMAGHFILGSSLFHLGRLEESETHLSTALSLASDASRSALMLFAGPDIEVFCRSYMAHVQWHRGAAGAATDAIREALDAAERVAHPFSWGIALTYAALLQLFRADPAGALERAEDAAALCRRHDFVYYLAIAEIVAGWAMASTGQPAAGLLRLRQGLEALKATGAEIRLPFYHGLLAEACARAGQMGEALANISNGFAFQRKNGEAWAAADLHRIHGDLLMQNGNPAEAELSYRRAAEASAAMGHRNAASGA